MTSLSVSHCARYHKQRNPKGSLPKGWGFKPRTWKMENEKTPCEKRLLSCKIVGNKHEIGLIIFWKAVVLSCLDFCSINNLNRTFYELKTQSKVYCLY